jgi:hypothetical protein
MKMNERDEQGETFNQDQQEMFQNPDTSPAETRPRTPGTQDTPPVNTHGEDSRAANEQSHDVDKGDFD